MRSLVRLIMPAAVFAAACGPSMSDELSSLDPADQECHALPDAVSATVPGVERSFGLTLKDPSRVLTIGIDSANRIRSIGASSHVKSALVLTVRASSALFDTAGAMSKAVRNVTTGDVDSRSVKTTGTSLSAKDTARIRALANEALKMCVR